MQTSTYVIDALRLDILKTPGVTNLDLGFVGAVTGIQILPQFLWTSEKMALTLALRNSWLSSLFFSIGSSSA